MTYCSTRGCAQPDVLGLSGNDTLVNQADGISQIQFTGDAGNDVFVNSGSSIASLVFNAGR